MNPKPTTCAGCPAYTDGIGFVPPTGPITSPVTFIGQGPGEQEAKTGVPFAPEGHSGHTLRRWMMQSGFQPSEALLLNVVWCWLPKGRKGRSPYGSRDPKPPEVKYCWEHHGKPALEKWTGRWCIPVGTIATKWLLGLPWDKGADRYAGTVSEVELP